MDQIWGSRPGPAAIEKATETFAADRISATYKIINFMSDAGSVVDTDEMADARIAAIGPRNYGGGALPPVDQINAVAVIYTSDDNSDVDNDYRNYVIGNNRHPSSPLHDGAAYLLTCNTSDPICPPGGGGLSEFEALQLLKWQCEAVSCVADIDEDCDVDQSDLGVFLVCYNDPTGPHCTQADLNGDGQITQADLGIFLTYYNSACGEGE